MRDVFCYGSLRVPAVWRHVTAANPPGLPAKVRGYRRWRVRGETYPAMVEAPLHEVDGWLWRGVDDAALARLDAFEGDEYRRITLLAEPLGAAPCPAEAWLFVAGARIDHRPWDYDEFLADALPAFLARHCAGD